MSPRYGLSITARHASRSRGFTLIEAALTMAIIGLGVVAMLELTAAGTTNNIEAAETTMAVNLAKNVREMTLKMSFDEVRAMNGQVFSPAVDSRGSAVAGFDNWSQALEVQSVDFEQLTLNLAEPAPTAIRVTVNVTRNDTRVGGLSWYRFSPAPPAP